MTDPSPRTLRPEDYQRTRDLLAKGKWVQDSFQEIDADGRHYYCLLGALGQVAHKRWTWFDEFSTDTSYDDIEQARMDEVRLLAEVIREQYPEVENGLGATATVVDFNDWHDRKLDDVLAVLEKAAVRAEEAL